MVQDIEAVDPEYYKNLRWMLENNITDVLDLTFTEESDYFGKKELVELKPGGKDIRSAHLAPVVCYQHFVPNKGLHCQWVTCDDWSVISVVILYTL